jgi:hypothetical protein
LLQRPHIDRFTSSAHIKEEIGIHQPQQRLCVAQTHQQLLEHGHPTKMVAPPPITTTLLASCHLHQIAQRVSSAAQWGSAHPAVVMAARTAIRIARTMHDAADSTLENVSNVM